VVASVLTTVGCDYCLYAHYVIGQDQDNRRIGTRPNQGRKPPLVWSVEFMKKVHVASNDIAPLVFPLVDRDGGAAKDLKGDWSVEVRWALLGATIPLIVVCWPHSN
jgi:hypothetical protein